VDGLNNQVSVLICSYDGAKEMWAPLEKAYQKYWPDCPFEINLLTNFELPKTRKFIPISIGGEISWSEKILKCLDKINSDYILLTYDDLFFYKNVNNEKVVDFVNFAVQNQLDYLSLMPHIKLNPNLKKCNGIFKLEKRRQYRNSSPWSIYKKEVLCSLLKPGESAWQFEKLGSYRSENFEEFYSVDADVFFWLNAIVRGKWKPNEYKKLIEEELIQSTSIPIMSPLKNLRRNVHMGTFNLLRRVLPLSVAYRIARIKDKFF